MMSTAQRLNAMPESEARQVLERCCASRVWIERMLARRPFADDAAARGAATDIWWSLSRGDWLEAFAAHPKIGDLESLRAKFANTAAWASGEQSGVAAASSETLHDLASYNQQYLERFGYIFIVCATGKSAEEMLSLLKCRFDNDADSELRIAAAEQLKISLLRLEKLSQ